MKLYKFLNENMTSTFQCHDWKKGWMPAIKGILVACENGYHLMREQDIIHWLGAVLWEVEYRGELLESSDKVVVREARLVKKIDTWNEKTQRRFACDCAKHVLHIFENEHPNDFRVRDCIEVARQYANGKAALDDLNAARSTVWGAGNSAWATARASRSTAWAAWDAAGDARDAACAAWAARDAVWAASDARDARDVEAQWQQEKLMEYLKL